MKNGVALPDLPTDGDEVTEQEVNAVAGAATAVQASEAPTK